MDGYANRPLVTAILFRRAARQANLSPDDQTALASVLHDRANLVVAGQTLDDMQSTTESGAMTTAKLGDGTLLSLLIANLPQILAAIMEILGALNKPAGTPSPSPAPVAHAAHASCGHGMPTNFALPALPPIVLDLLEQAAVAAVKAVLPTMEVELRALLHQAGVL